MKFTKNQFFWLSTILFVAAWLLFSYLWNVGFPYDTYDSENNLYEGKYIFGSIHTIFNVIYCLGITIGYVVIMVGLFDSESDHLNNFLKTNKKYNVVNKRINNMDIKELKKDDLLKLKDEIDLQLDRIKHIDELKIEINKSKEKTSLSDLDKNDKIFCMIIYDSKIYKMDYVEITFSKHIDQYNGWTNFSVTNPCGCSSSVKDECMSNYCFLSDFGSSYYFFTLKPENWRNDLNLELIRYIKEREIVFNKDIQKFKDTIYKVIEDDDHVDEFIKSFEE